MREQFKLDVCRQETYKKQETDLVLKVTPQEVGHLKTRDKKWVDLLVEIA